MEAQLSITGWVGGDVDLRHTQATGTSRATFRLACTPRVRRQGSWTDDPTTWLTVTCWRALAEHVASSLGKGEPVLVIGRLRTQAWQDDEGVKHERLVLDATSVGHDLAKGTAAFRRTPPRPRKESTDGRLAADSVGPETDTKTTGWSTTDLSGGGASADPPESSERPMAEPGFQPSAEPATV